MAIGSWPQKRIEKVADGDLEFFLQGRYCRDRMQMLLIAGRGRRRRRERRRGKLSLTTIRVLRSIGIT
jgi:hypothetical protein